MSWVEVSQGEWRRGLGGLEKTYRFISQMFNHTGKEHWGLYAVCTVEPRVGWDMVAGLQEGWKSLRHEFPGLAVKPDGYEAVYSAATPEAVEDWVRETFIIERDINADDIIAEYPLRDLPALYIFPKKSEVMLLTSHWRVDAIGCCMLLKRLLSLATGQGNQRAQGIDIGEEIKRLSPPMEDAAGSPHDTTAEINATTKQVTSNFAQKARNSIGIAYNGTNVTPPGPAASQSVVLSPQSTDRLVKACRQREISVSAAVYAALGSCIMDLRSEKGDSEYSTILAVNMRPFLPPPYDGVDQACQTYVSSITPTMYRGENFQKNTESLTAYFRTWHTPEFNMALRQIYARASSALINMPPPAGPPSNPPHGITLSSLGVIDKYMTPSRDDGIQVASFRFGVSMLTRQMILYVWTFRGRLSLSINYNVAYYDDLVVRRVLDCLRVTLQSELGVVLDS